MAQQQRDGDQPWVLADGHAGDRTDESIEFVSDVEFVEEGGDEPTRPREIVCVLRYKFHAVCATGLASDAVKAEFAQHAKEEEEHLDLLAERINQLGGKPNLNPDGIISRAASEYVEGGNLVEMIQENLIAERIAIDTYREMVRYFGDKDPTTRVLLERILAKEEEHANDMLDLLVGHESLPMLEE